MFEEVWQKVVSGKYDKTKATLYGYNRKTVKNEVYPALVKGTSDSSVHGVVYKGVNLKDLMRLDEFEGEYYKRETGRIELPGNVIITTVFYLLKPSYHYIISDQQWDEERFKTIGINKFLEQYFGFRNLTD